MSNQGSIGIVLRYRDLVTEIGGTIAEHRKVLRHHGFVWWGWWRRQAEHVPKTALARLFDPERSVSVPVMLFDSGTLKLYASVATKVVVAPSLVGIQTPQLELTPEYYVRGRYHVWFYLKNDAIAVNSPNVVVMGRPTDGPESDDLPAVPAQGEVVSLENLRDERPTFWLARPLINNNFD